MLRKKINFKLGEGPIGFLVPGIAVGLLGFLSIVTLNPMRVSSASAAEEMTLLAFLSPSITLSMSSSVSENVEPTVDGAFKNLSTVARVQVMNSDYYDISISGNPDMVGTANPDSKISAVAGSKKASEFTNNTWGYSASKNGAGVTTAVAADNNTVYAAVPATSTQIVGRQNTTDNAADDYYSLNFGAKVDTSIPADTYTSRVTVSVVASPVLVAEFGGISMLQELTMDVCSEAKEGETAFLRDNRAATNADTSSLNKYWVTKLPDGNCWMTQNLDYATAEQKLDIGTAQPTDTGKVWDNGLKVVTGFGQSAVDASGNYNAHYLTGNYYQQSAAESACPAIGSQWRLPTANQATTVNGSYNKLLDDVSATQIVDDPYYFLPAGLVSRSSGSLSGIGVEGFYRSSIPGYILYFWNNLVTPLGTDGSDGSNGYSVRCYVSSQYEYSVVYDANDGTGTVPTTQIAQGKQESQEFTVAGQGSLAKTGYTFLGWAEDKDATTATYMVGNKITLTKDKQNVTLYAVWKKVTLSGISNMQDLNAAVCANSAANETKQLKDTRDNKVYWVAKLADGNCWMTQNMDYEISGKTTTIGTARNPDGGYFWENGFKVMNTPSGSVTTDVSSGWTASTDVDFYTKNSNSAVNATNKTYDAHYLMGNHYQFSAAPAVCTGIGSQWNLPTSNQSTTTNGSFNKLANGQDASSDSWVMAKPYFFPRAGRVDGRTGSLGSTVGEEGYYWSDTMNSTSSGYYLNFGSYGVRPSQSWERYHGFPIRCYVDGN